MMQRLLPRVARLVARRPSRHAGARPFTAFTPSSPLRASDRSPASAAEAGISPYRVLGIPRHASEPDIRARFRELAYRLHPDLNHGAGAEEEIALSGSDGGDGGKGGPAVYIDMADVVEAYEALMSGGGAAARDSRVGSSVEKFTIRELMDDEEHTVVPLTMVMDVLLEAGDGEVAAGRREEGEPVKRGSMASHANRGLGKHGGMPAGDGGKNDGEIDDADDPVAPLRVHASGFDAVADLKRDLQAQFGRAWGLQGRRFDHENVAIGWELVHDATVLCPNYFLEDYGIETGDTVHAVIRDYDD